MIEKFKNIDVRSFQITLDGEEKSIYKRIKSIVKNKTD